MSGVAWLVLGITLLVVLAGVGAGFLLGRASAVGDNEMGAAIVLDQLDDPDWHR